MKINPLTQIDFYKVGHIHQYPPGTEFIYSNFTPRSDKLFKNKSPFYDGQIVFFGLQGFIKTYLQESWNEGFFNQPKEVVVEQYRRRIANALGPDAAKTEHIEALHDLGYLPITIRALPEGSKVPIGVPVFTIENTVAEFYWLTNYLETVLSQEIWKPCHTATTAHEFRKVIDHYAELTGSDPFFANFQGHDFSSRGLSGLYDANSSAAGHLLSFYGTDTVAAIDYLENYYGANSYKEIVGTSVPATEHSVMSLNAFVNLKDRDDITDKDLLLAEIETYRRLITEVYPSGIVSIVSDTFSFWDIMSELTVALKDAIMNRKPDELGLAKVVFRPDSGDPVKIICGDPNATDERVRKGAVEVLWDIFGGTITKNGYKLLDSHVGLIYGDSITMERCEAILAGLEEKGFASGNIVFGIGSYTYNYCTRDSIGFAMKATFGIVNGIGYDIYKNPKTDSGKKSSRGLLKVVKDEYGVYRLVENVGFTELEDSCLVPVFKNGVLLKEYTLAEIRKNLSEIPLTLAGTMV